jgi:hypothetical protein
MKRSVQIGLLKRARYEATESHAMPSGTAEQPSRAAVAEKLCGDIRFSFPEEDNLKLSLDADLTRPDWNDECLPAGALERASLDADLV